MSRLQLGDHVCWTFDDDQRRLELAASYVRAGLASKQKVLYYTDTLLPEALLAGLDSLGVPVSTALGRGQLRVTRICESYLGRRRFDPARMLAGWSSQIATVRHEGWAGLRTVGDMAWAAGQVSGGQHLSWYEAQLNRALVDGHAMVMCLYDRRLFTTTELDRFASAHPGTAWQNPNPHWRPLLRMRRTTNPPGLRLSGEADLSNGQALFAVLAGLFDHPPDTGSPFTIDMSGFEYADAAAARQLARTAQAAPTALRVVGCSPILTRVLDLVSDGAWSQSVT